MKALLSALLVFSLFNLHSQSREDTTLPEFQLTNINTLLFADGWALNKQKGEWVKNTNIAYDMELDSRPSNIAMNFDSIYFDLLIVDGDSLFIMFINKIGGQYKYRSIREGWYAQQILKYIVFNRKGIDRINYIINNPSEEIHFIKAMYTGELRDIARSHKNRAVITQIEAEYNTYKSEKTESLQKWGKLSKSSKKRFDNSYQKYWENTHPLEYLDFPFTSQKINGLHIVRFDIGCTGKYGIDSALKERYFESPASSWVDLISPLN